MKPCPKSIFNIFTFFAILASLLGGVGIVTPASARPAAGSELHDSFPLFISGSLKIVDSEGVVTPFSLKYLIIYNAGAQDITFGSDGKLYAADSSGLAARQYAYDGVFTYIDQNTNNGQAYGITSDADGYVYTSSNGFGPGPNISRWNTTNNTNVNYEDEVTGLTAPRGMAVNGGYLYVADGNGNIQKIGPGGSPVTTFASGLSDPRYIAFDAAGNLYVSEYSAGNIKKITSGGTVSTFVTGLSNVTGLAFDSVGYLYALNNGDSTLKKISADGSSVTTFATGVSGGGISFASRNMMTVKGNNTRIASGDTSPATMDHTSFGYVDLTAPLTRTYTIKNIGGADLNLTGTAPDYVTISGANAGDFTLTQPASGAFTAGQQGTFGIEFVPGAYGLRTATVSIANDSITTPFTFDISGFGCDNAIIVNTAADSGAGSLRDALTRICDGGTITFAANYTITLASTLPTVDRAITITGNGAANTIIQASDCNPITLKDSSNVACTRATYRILNIAQSGNLTLNDVTMQNGACSGACFNNTKDAGAIFNLGNLTINNSILSNNYGDSANGSGGAIVSLSPSTTTLVNDTFSNNSSSYGGAISIGGTATITNSTFSSNQSTKYGGGALVLDSGTLTITNSTFTGNSETTYGGGAILNYSNLIVVNSTFFGNESTGVSGMGGAILNDYGTSLTVVNSTISGNTAAAGGGIYNNNTVLSLKNTILANSTGGIADCYNVTGDTIGTNINSLIKLNGAAGHMCGTPALTDDPMLSALANNGGPTQTMALQAGSPAIDAGDNTVCANVGTVNNKDQRGVTRPQDGDGNNTAICDIGAYEVPDTTAPTVTSSVRASTNPTSASNVDFTVTFSEPVIGVDPSDFSLTTNSVSSSAVSGVSGSGSVYTVTVNTGVGSGTLRLDVLDNDGITDLSLNPLSAGLTTGETYTISKTPIFIDVPYSYWANSYIERLYTASITGGCVLSPLQYCPDSTVTRAQMAIFLLKGIHGSSYTPPAVNGNTGFSDVAADYWAAAWIKQLAAEGITSGCGAGIYCPDSTVTRAQMAIFLLKAKNGSSYAPPAVGGSTGFNDVATDYWAAPFIKQLVTDGITSGCGAGNYCPDDSVTRAQMAIFLVRTFNLP